MTKKMDTKQTTPEDRFKERDPYAWIVLRLPKKYWVKGQIILEKLKDTFRWNIINGEMKFDDPKISSKNLKNSNIVQIVHHALNENTPEPNGYKTVFPFLVKGCTLPKGFKKEKKTQLKKKKPMLSDVGKGKVSTVPFVKDKMLWEIISDSD